MNNILNKGPLLEESLRSYFMQAGYYTVRGVPFNYEGYDITDIDLWLYARGSSVSREIAIVDIKNKKTPQAIERVFWVCGLKAALKADQAIVATTDKRPEVKEFGKTLGILVLDGNFLSKLEDKNKHLEFRFSDEEFNDMLSSHELNKLDGDWKGRVYFSKSLFAKGLSFDVCNEWLLQGRFFAEQAATKVKRSDIALRCLYLICSFISIAIDYELRDISFSEISTRAKVIADGFTYGSKGRAGTKKIVDLSMGLVSEYANNGRAIANQVRMNVEKSLENIPSVILGEYFSKRDVQGTLFNTAREFEQLAFSRTFASHSQASIEVKSFLGCLLDYWGIDRTHVNLSHTPEKNNLDLTFGS